MASREFWYLRYQL